MKYFFLGFVILALLGLRGFNAYLTSDTAQSDAEQIAAEKVVTLPPSLLQELNELLSRKDESSGLDALYAFFTEQLQLHPIQVVRLIQQLGGVEDRELSYRVALDIWDDLDQSALLSWLETSQLHNEFDPALWHLANKSYSLYSVRIVYATNILDSSKRSDTVETLLADWTLIQPEEAILWSLQSKEAKQNLILVFDSLVSSDLLLAISLSSLLEGGDDLLVDAAIDIIARELAAGNFDSQTITAIQTIRSYEIREKLVGVLVVALFEGQETPLADIDLLISTLMPGEFQDELKGLLAKNWVFNDPVEAAEYAASLEGENRESAIEGVISSWLETDLEKAHEWLVTVEGNLDLAANTLARGSATLGNMEIADNWLNYVEDDQMRTQAINDVVSEWYQRDPKVGLHYLVYQENLSVQQKLSVIHNWFPDRTFVSPEQALIQLNREGI